LYEAVFAETVARLRDRLPRVRERIEIADGSPPTAFAVPFEEIARTGAERLVRVHQHGR
jgi:hypothetical protein